MEPNPGEVTAAISSRMLFRSHEHPRIAFFGGSFDPPHLGHLAVARAAQRALQLDTVLFAPVGAQPLKPLGSTAQFKDRLAMTSLAISEDPGFELSLIDAPCADARPNYTVDTLRALRGGMPSTGSLFCLMGADSFRSLRHWHRGDEVPFEAALIVASRPGQPLDDLASHLPSGLTLHPLPGSGEQPEPAAPGASGTHELRSYVIRNSAGQAAPFHLLPGLDVEISASEIRRQVRCCADDPNATQNLLPSSVAEYIRAHGLYR